MPFHQEWFIPDQIVKVTFTGSITAEEIAKSFKVSGKFLMESQADRIHFIHDWSEIETFPTNLSQIRNAVEIGQNPAMSKLGWVVIYGVRHKLLRFVGDLVFQLFQIRTHSTDDMDSALAFIYKQDPTIKPRGQYTAVKWYLKGRILYCYDVMSVDDMIARNQNALDLLEHEGQPPSVHMLIDFSSTDKEGYSADIRELVRRSTSSEEFASSRDNLVRHPLFGWVVVFNIHDRNIAVSGKIVSTKYNYKRKEVNSLEEAIAFLKQIDPRVAIALNSDTDDRD